MIARIWQAASSVDGAKSYAEHFKSQVLPALKPLSGYRGAYLLNRETPKGIDITVITFWSSMEAILKFAGTEITRAVVADDAVRVLISYDREVTHCEVAAVDGDDRSAASAIIAGQRAFIQRRIDDEVKR